jgi:signal transduction histidine kinase
MMPSVPSSNDVHVAHAQPRSVLVKASAWFRGETRIVLVSGLTVALVAVAVGVTLWSYSTALDARRAADSSRQENELDQRAQAYYFHERELADQYLFVKRPEILREVREFGARFHQTLAAVERGQPQPFQERLVRRALAGNKRFLSQFFSGIEGAVRSQETLSQFSDTVLEESERTTLDPLDTLSGLNLQEARRSDAHAKSRERLAIIASLVAGGLAVAVCLAFGFYAAGLVRRITRQREALSRLDRVKDDFIASVSHELRTPLTSIRGYLELILDDEVGEVSEEQREFLQIIERNSDRLMSLIGDLLFSAQVEAGRLELELEDVELGVLVDDSVESARPRAAANGVELTGSTTDALALRGDTKRLSQLLDNLVSNAVKFTPSGGTVAVSLTRADGRAVIEVSDTGTGIAPEDQARLFERFYRTSNAATIPGTGLGLSIAKVIVEAHGGVIEVASDLGSGTTFRVELPLVPTKPLEVAV